MVPASIWYKRATCASRCISTLNVIAYAEFESVLEIDKNRNIIYDFYMDIPQIARLLAMDARTKSIFRDVVPKDGLSTTIYALQVAFMCNTDDADEPGEHWIAVKDDYFCSYGLPPPHSAFCTFMNEYCSEWTHNSKRLENPLSNVCVQYCVAYLLPMRTFANIFGTDLVANDCRVFDWRKELRQDRLCYCTSYTD